MIGVTKTLITRTDGCETNNRNTYTVVPPSRGMDLTELRTFAQDSQPIETDTEASLLLSTKVGQLSRVLLQEDAGTVESEEAVKQAVGGVIMAAIHVGEYHDVHTDEALHKIIEQVEERQATAQKMEDAMDALDYERIAEIMGMTDEEPEQIDTTKDTEAFY